MPFTEKQNEFQTLGVATMIEHSVLMPFSRPKFLPALREHMRGQGVTWRPLCNDKELLNPELWNEKPGDAVWIKPWYGNLPTKDGVPTVNPGHWLCDAFLDAHLDSDFFRKDHYVSFFTDDCLWNWNYWRKIQKHFVKRNRQGGEYAPAVIITATTVPGNGSLGLVQPKYSPDWGQSSLRTFATRFEVLTARADLLKTPRFGSFWAGDGVMVERLVEENVGAMPENVVCVQDAIVYFNALRPECYGFPSEHQR